MDVKESDVKISFCGSYLIRFIFLRLFKENYAQILWSILERLRKWNVVFWKANLLS